jgi:hypothetical protein
MPREIPVTAAELRTRVRRFVSSQSWHGQRLQKIFDRISDHDWTAVLFGGVLRDLMLGIGSHRPRDVDIVVEGATSNELLRVFHDLVLRRNRFGGLQLARRGLAVDVWPLSATWAFSQFDDGQDTLSNLPKTTFLNIEAVAIEVANAVGRPRKVYSSGFFESLDQRVLELNFPQNPFPALCVVRSLVMARKLGFGIGPRLANYIRVHSRDLTMEDLVVAQSQHYGRVLLTEASLERCFRAVDEPLSADEAPLTLPSLEPLQLELADLDIPLRGMRPLARGSATLG